MISFSESKVWLQSVIHFVLWPVAILGGSNSVIIREGYACVSISAVRLWAAGSSSIFNLPKFISFNFARESLPVMLNHENGETN